MRILSLATLLISTPAAAQALVTPQQALDAVLASPLTLVGTYISPFSQSGTTPSCVFRNEHATVVSEYCIPEDIPALALRVIPHAGGGTVRFYLQTEGSLVGLRRADYDPTAWAVRVSTNHESYDAAATAEAMRAYEEASEMQPGCAVMEYTGLGEMLYCADAMDFDAGVNWLVEAKIFRDEPTQSWYQVQELIRAETAKAFAPAEISVEPEVVTAPEPEAGPDVEPQPEIVAEPETQPDPQPVTDASH